MILRNTIAVLKNRRARPAAMLLLLAAAACNPLGAVLYKLTPDPEQDALYKLQDRPTAILVENFSNPDLAATDAELLTRNIAEDLDEVVVDKKKIVQIVPFEKVLDLRNSKPKDFASMTIPQIGKAVGAEQVIYVDLQTGGVAPMATGSALQGRASALVKVVDVATGDTLWPTETADGHPVNAQTNPLAGQEPTNYNAVRAEVFDNLAAQIAKMFFKYQLNNDHPDNLPVG